MGNINLSFTGEYEYSLDQKSRLIIPARFRKSLGEENNKTFVLTRGLDCCLTLYPLNEWNNVELQLGQLSTIKEKNRNLIYIYHLNPIGFILISADDNSHPVIGYSFKNNFNTQNMPTNINWLFENIKKKYFVQYRKSKYQN